MSGLIWVHIVCKIGYQKHKQIMRRLIKTYANNKKVQVSLYILLGHFYLLLKWQQLYPVTLVKQAG